MIRLFSRVTFPLIEAGGAGYGENAPPDEVRAHEFAALSLAGILLVSGCASSSGFESAVG